MSDLYFVHFIIVLFFAAIFVISKSLVIKSITMFFVLISDSLISSLIKDDPIVAVIAVAIAVVGLMVFSIASMQSFGSRDYSKKIKNHVRIVDVIVVIFAFSAQFVTDFFWDSEELLSNTSIVVGDEFKMVIPLIVSSFILTVFLLSREKQGDA